MDRRSSTRWFLLLALCWAGVSVWAQRAAASEPVLNESCPVMTEEKADPKITVVHEGRTIAFCCDTCRTKFLANPDRYLGRLPRLGGSKASVPTDDHGDDDHGSGGHESGESATADSQASSSVAEGRHSHEEGGGDEAAGDVDSRDPLLGRFHPAVIHFPVAGLPLALLGFAAWMLTGRESWARADVPPLVVGTLGAIAAVITGNIAHDAMRFSENLQQYVDRHQLISTVVMVLAIVLLAVRLWRWDRLRGAWRWAYGGGLLVASGLLGVTGYLGGSLVFGPEHLKW